LAKLDGQEIMSEPMSTGEIEDVLSSIRRLVSEDLRPVPARVPADRSTQPTPDGFVPGKLVLTPSLRVVKNHPDEVTALLLVDGAQGVPQDLTAMEEWLPESSTSPTDDIWQSASHRGDVWAEAGADDAPEAADPTTHDDAPTPLNVTRVVSEIAAAVADTTEEWEPEAEDTPAPQMTWQDPEWVKDADVLDEVEHDITSALADAAEAAAVAEIMSRAVPPGQDGSARGPKAVDGQADIAQDARYFDEDVLRDLVRDLIQEELSGALGERITRNVRKLVRAEINRALTSRDLA
jgi:hypothetical protein